MRRRQFPLNALKAFEVAARHGGFVQAARELNVTPSAVSQQVKGLEEFLGRQLFQRHNNRIVLTDAGLTIYPALAESFDRLDDTLRRALEQEVRSRIVVSVLPSLACRWMTDVLSGFLADEPDIKIDLRIEEDPVEFAAQGIELRICYGAHLYPDLAVMPLLTDSVVPLCCPAFLNGIRRSGPAGRLEPQDLADHDLIHTEWGPAFASLPTWADWFQAAGLDRQPAVGQGHRVGQSSVAIDFALAGMGVALGQRLLARQELADGRLVAPLEPAVPLASPYCMVSPHARAQRPALVRLIGWLQDRARETPA